MAMPSSVPEQGQCARPSGSAAPGSGRPASARRSGRNCWSLRHDRLRCSGLGQSAGRTWPGVPPAVVAGQGVRPGSCDALPVLRGACPWERTATSRRGWPRRFGAAAARSAAWGGWVGLTTRAVWRTTRRRSRHARRLLRRAALPRAAAFRGGTTRRAGGASRNGPVMPGANGGPLGRAAAGVGVSPRHPPRSATQRGVTCERLFELGLDRGAFRRGCEIAAGEFGAQFLDVVVERNHLFPRRVEDGRPPVMPGRTGLKTPQAPCLRGAGVPHFVFCGDQQALSRAISANKIGGTAHP